MATPADNEWTFFASDGSMSLESIPTSNVFRIGSSFAVSKVSTPTKHGVGSIRIQLDSTGGVTVKLPDTLQRVYDTGTDYTSTAVTNDGYRLGFWWRTSSLPTGTDITIATVTGYTGSADETIGVMKCRNSDDKIIFEDGGDVIAGPTAAADTWYYIEISIDPDGASATQRLWVDGTAYTGTFAVGTGSDAYKVVFGTVNASISGEFQYIESVWFAYGYETTQTFTNPAICSLDQNGDSGTYDTWTGTPSTTDKWGNVDGGYNVPGWNYTSTNTNIQASTDSASIASQFSSTVDSIIAVSVILAWNRQSSPACNGRSIIYNSGVGTVQASTWAPPRETSGQEWEQLISTSVDGAASSWTTATAEAAELGYEHLQSQSRELQVKFTSKHIFVEIADGAATSVKDVIGQGIVPFAR